MNRKIYFLIVCAIILSLSMQGQSTFFNTYEAPTTGNTATMTLNLPGGKLLTGGTISDFATGSKEIMLVKTDTAGNLHWTKTLGTTDPNYFVSMSSAMGGQIAILAYDSIAGQRYHSMMLIDTAGNVNFQKTFLLPPGIELWHEKILSLTNGNLIVYGTYGGHVVLVNMNTLGVINWTRDLSTVIPGVSLTTVDLSEMSNGDLALITNMVGGSLLKNQFALLLLNNTANVLSSQSFSTTVDLRATRVYYLPYTGDILIGAEAEDGKIMLIRLDSGGTMYWSRSFATTILNNGGMIDMVFFPVSEECVTLSADNGYGFEVNRFNVNGDFQWSTAGQYHNEMPGTLLIDPSGAFMLTGNILSTSTSFHNMFLARIMSDGLLCDNSINHSPYETVFTASPVNESFTVNAQFTLTDTTITDTTRLYLLVPTEKCQEFVGISSPEKAFTLHSNIVSQQLQLRTFEPYNKSDVLYITDLSGRMVATQQPSTGVYEISLDVSMLHEGYYIVSIYTKGTITKDRFLIVR